MKLPPNLPVSQLEGLELIHRGKVRDTYALPDHPELRLVVITDRSSVHDVVLLGTVPYKGCVLNYMDLWWRSQFDSVDQDVVAWGEGIDTYLPASLHNNYDLHMRARVCRTLKMMPAELIVRGYLTGSALVAYNRDGKVCDQDLVPGLKEWDKLDPLFTPTTKSSEGHDIPIGYYDFLGKFGIHPVQLVMRLYIKARKIAEERGFELIDTKFEVGRYPNLEKTGLVIADEILTPDSSRYILTEDLAAARALGERPPSFDKQQVRDWATNELGLTPQTELTDEVVGRVQQHEIPGALVESMCVNYITLFKNLTGRDIGVFSTTFDYLKAVR